MRKSSEIANKPKAKLSIKGLLESFNIFQCAIENNTKISFVRATITIIICKHGKEAYTHLSDFFFLGFSPLLRTLIPTWVIPSKKCTIYKVPYNAIPEPSKLIRRLLMPTPTWRPYTKTPEIYRKLSNPIVQL